MFINDYYKQSTDIPTSGSYYELAQLVSKLYTKKCQGMQRIKEESLSLIQFLNAVNTIVNELENDPLPSMRINKMWESLNPQNEKEGNDGFHTKRWYETTIIFGGVYYILAKGSNKDEELLATIEEKTAYDEKAKPYFDYFKVASYSKNQDENVTESDRELLNQILNDLFMKTKNLSDEQKLIEYDRAIKREQEKEEPNSFIIRGIAQYSDALRKRETSKEIKNTSYTPPLKNESQTAMIDVDLLMETFAKYAPDIAERVFDLIGYIIHSKYGDIIEKFEANKNMQLKNLQDKEKLTSNKFRLGNEQIGNMAKIIQVLCDLKIIVKADGSDAKPVNEVGQLIGKMLGQDYKNWSQTLKGAFDQNNYLDVFQKWKLLLRIM